MVSYIRHCLGLPRREGWCDKLRKRCCNTCCRSSCIASSISAHFKCALFLLSMNYVPVWPNCWAAFLQNLFADWAAMNSAKVGSVASLSSALVAVCVGVVVCVFRENMIRVCLPFYYHSQSQELEARLPLAYCRYHMWVVEIERQLSSAWQ